MKLFMLCLAVALLSSGAPAQTNTPTQVTDHKSANTDPSFEVATIKPSDPDHPASVPPLGHRIAFPGTTVRFLMALVYDVHDKQIVGAPEWMATEKLDFDGLPNTPSAPTLQQIQIMFQKLFAERLQLKFHHEKRELSAYVLVVAKSGPKLAKSPDDSTGLPSLLGSPKVGMNGRNITMTTFAHLLQSGILDRPVVDRTNLPGKYDFQLKWTPDESQFTQAGVRISPSSDTGDAPGLFTAIQEQLGLRLSVAKVPVDVLVIDHIEKPSEN